MDIAQTGKLVADYCEFVMPQENTEGPRRKIVLAKLL